MGQTAARLVLAGARADGTLRAYGPAAPAEGLPLPAGSSLDPAGFLIAAP